MQCGRAGRCALIRSSWRAPNPIWAGGAPVPEDGETGSGSGTGWMARSPPAGGSLHPMDRSSSPPPPNLPPPAAARRALAAE
eukprot:scaffold1786_cov398-Prasinococcus_capsulatus_cf.AAC.9